MPNAYIDVFTYQRAATGLEKSSLVGNTGRLTSSVALGATSLAVGPPTTVALQQFDQITIFDGNNTEIVMIASNTAIGVTSLPLLAGTQFAHAQYTPFATDGILGSLPDSIIEASNWIENICQQTLFQQAYANETLQIPSMRASFDNAGMLAFRTRHFPIIAESGIQIASDVSSVTTYDQTQIILDSTSQVCTVPWLNITSAQSNQNALYGNVAPRREMTLYLYVSYTAGYLATNMPGDIRDAAVLLASDIIGRRQNPLGSQQLRLGDKQIQATSPRDMIGESLLVKIAKQKLQPYSMEAL